MVVCICLAQGVSGTIRCGLVGIGVATEKEKNNISGTFCGVKAQVNQEVMTCLDVVFPLQDR